MHNSTFGEDNKCLENYHGDDTWKCLQAQVCIFMIIVVGVNSPPNIKEAYPFNF